MHTLLCCFEHPVSTAVKTDDTVNIIIVFVWYFYHVLNILVCILPMVVSGCWNLYVVLGNCIFMYTICSSIGLKKCRLGSQPFVKNQEWQLNDDNFCSVRALFIQHTQMAWHQCHPLPILPVLVGQGMGRHLCLIKLVVSSRREIYIYHSWLTKQILFFNKLMSVITLKC